MFFQGMLASIRIGSDLYMILTGFLCCNKTFGSTFYKSGIKVILSYIFFSLLTIVVNVYLLHTGMTWRSGISGIFSFTTITYAWYIEMWIGLFLLAPFLNIWYKSLPDKRMKLYLIGLLLLLSALPDFFNRNGRLLMPQYWNNIYPITFYFTGCFLREYRPKVNVRILIATGLAIISLSSLYTLAIGHQTYVHITGNRNGIFMATLATVIFLAFYNTDIKSSVTKSIFKAISLRSLDIFLCSAILDSWIYSLFMERYFVNQSQFGMFYFIIVPLIFSICFTTASIKRLLFSLAQAVLDRLGISISLQSTDNTKITPHSRN